jgi:hypothetical protein
MRNCILVHISFIRTKYTVHESGRLGWARFGQAVISTSIHLILKPCKQSEEYDISLAPSSQIQTK